MRDYQRWILPLFIVLASGCSSSSDVVRYSGSRGETSSTPPAETAESLLPGQGALEEAERLAREETARRAELARLEAEAAARREEELRREEAARQRAEEERLARQRADQQRAEQQRAARERAARELADKQARVDELRERIAATDASAARLDEANLVMREAVTAAENLVQALSTEQDKYTSADPATGLTAEELDKASLDALQVELDRLKARAEMLMGQAGR